MLPTPASLRFPLRAARLLVLATGFGLALGAAQASGHGHEDEHASAPKEEPKVIAKDSLKNKLAAVKTAPMAETRAVKAEVKTEVSKEAAQTPKDEPTSVSMSELRELIDQKIAEVRAKQAAAPAVKIVNKSPKPRKPVQVAMNDASKPGMAAKVPGLPAGHDLHWEYNGATGPQTWGQLKPEFQTCNTGTRQSPIDIRDGIKVQLEPIQFDYRPSAFRVIDNGHTVQVNVDSGNFITVSGRRYELVQFHFHRPSEERINGRQYEMVAHLVHKDAQGKLAVIAVLLDQGKEHPMVQLVWNSLPLEKSVEQASPVLLDMNLMLPEQRQYYTYMGSLTTPPCTEGVLWLVMKQPATLSPYQASVFSRLYANNARPIQSPGGRMIKEGL
ncbi:carbonic anhydrase [Aquabacterium sp.]|uniref:carbonic anhydrase n=1 Tax=Aquabacterium sp. TaxID=1872578 RepID=UPI003D6C7840